MDIRVRRVYEPAEPDDGTRVLIDRLWPRGLSKAEAEIDDWPKEVAPSTELRRWFHGPGADAWEEFRTRYEAELAAPGPAADALERLRERAGEDGGLTLLTASRDPGRSNAAVLAEVLRARSS